MVIFTIILIINIIHEKYVIKKLKEKVDFQKKVEKELNEIFEKLK